MNPYFAWMNERLPEIEQLASETGSVDAAELLFMTYGLGKAITGVRANLRRAMDWWLLKEIAETHKNRRRKYAVSPRFTDLLVERVLDGTYKVSWLDFLAVDQYMQSKK